MKRSLSLALSLVALLASAAPANDLHVGFATVDITPPVGYRMSGYFFERPSTGTHDPLNAKAIVLKQGETHAAIVVCDLIGIAADITQQARERAARQTGIPAENICIAATHSHTGPLYGGALREHFHNKAVEKQGRDPFEAVDYPAVLVKKLVEVIEAAHQAARPAAFASGIAEERSLSFNRRFHMRDGSVVFNPGRQNPNIVRVAGPIDPEVGLIRFTDAASEQPLGLLTVFALHLDTTSGTLYSADYPYFLQESLRAKFGDTFHSVFAAGTCGDINHVDVSQPAPAKLEQPEAARIGKALGEKVLSALDQLTPQPTPSLAVRRTVVTVPKQQYSEQEIARARERMDKVGGRELTFLEQVETTKIVELQLRKEDEIPLEVQVFRLSDTTAVVCLPGEVFVDLGLAIKAGSPFKTTLVMELCNDSPAYIPTRKAFAEGSYETVNSRVVPGSGEKMMAAAIDLLEELKSE
jgi:neutral ceramidase